MNWNWLIHVGVASQVLPVVAALQRRRWLDPARRAALAWALLLLANNAIALSMALFGQRNLWLGYTLNPLRAAVALWVLAKWQTGPVSRTAMQLLIPLYLAAFAVLTLAVEDVGDFSLAAAPFTSLLLLGASLYTVIVRSQGEPTRLGDADWFWIGLGFALYYASDAALQPLSRLLLGQRPDLVVEAYRVRGVVALLVSLVLARGFLCPNPPTRSSPSLSSASPRSSSSSPRSGSPS